MLSFVRGDLNELQGFVFSLIALAVNDFDVVLSLALSDSTESGLFNNDNYYSKSAFGLLSLVFASLLLVVLVVKLAAVVAIDVRGDVIEAYYPILRSVYTFILVGLFYDSAYLRITESPASRFLKSVIESYPAYFRYYYLEA